jgi:hypothetical protein
VWVYAVFIDISGDMVIFIGIHVEIFHIVGQLNKGSSSECPIQYSTYNILALVRPVLENGTGKRV